MRQQGNTPIPVSTFIDKTTNSFNDLQRARGTARLPQQLVPINFVEHFRIRLARGDGDGVGVSHWFGLVANAASG